MAGTFCNLVPKQELGNEVLKLLCFSLFHFHKVGANRREGKVLEIAEVLIGPVDGRMFFSRRDIKDISCFDRDLLSFNHFD